MTVKSQSRTFPALLNHHYSGTMATLLYNWPIFAGAALFGLVTLVTSMWIAAPWSWLFMAGGGVTLALALSILAAAYVVYDGGGRREYDRLADLGGLERANVVVDITCGKLRGTRGLLARFRGGHYFLIDLYDPAKMNDTALRRARAMEPPLQAERRIYRRPGRPATLPLPHNWADVVYCHFSLHELQSAADRQALFAEFARVLKPDGRLLLAEHGRDLPNLIAFGPGAFSFLSPATWQKHMAEAGLTVYHHERWRGLVHLWVAGRKPR